MFTIPDTLIHSLSPSSDYSWSAAKIHANTTTQYSTSTATSATRELQHLSKARFREDSSCPIQLRRHPYFNHPWFHTTTVSRICACEQIILQSASSRKHLFTSAIRTGIFDNSSQDPSIGTRLSDLGKSRQIRWSWLAHRYSSLSILEKRHRRTLITRTDEVMTHTNWHHGMVIGCDWAFYELLSVHLHNIGMTYGRQRRRMFTTLQRDGEIQGLFNAVQSVLMCRP